MKFTSLYRNTQFGKAPEIKAKVVKPLAEGELSDQNYDDDDYEEINDDEDDDLFENQYNKKKEEDEEYSS
jgi:hypothetical protein